jgi:hypothetical protein
LPPSTFSSPTTSTPGPTSAASLLPRVQAPRVSIPPLREHPEGQEVLLLDLDTGAHKWQTHRGTPLESTREHRAGGRSGRMGGRGVYNRHHRVLSTRLRHRRPWE